MARDTLSPAFDANLLSRIEDAGLNASAPPQQRWLDGWLLRLSPGKAKRARCINAVAAGRLPLDAKLAACQRAFDAAGLPLIMRITPFSLPGNLDATLAHTGLARFDDTRVMVLADLGATAPRVLPRGLSLHPVALEPFAQRVGQLRGSPLAQRAAHAERLTSSPVPFSAWELRRDSETLACGQIAVEDDIAGLYDVYTAEAARSQGLATLLCTALLDDAIRRGARHAYLQVESDNHPARAVYRRLGFSDGYAYHYRTSQPDDAR